MIYKIAVDNGHGIDTPGKRTPGPVDGVGRVVHEKEFNRPAADAFISACARQGFSTVDCAPGWDDVPLTQRWEAANAFGADAFVSFHYNAAGEDWVENATGIEVVYSQYAGERTHDLARNVLNELLLVRNQVDRGTKSDIQQVGFNIAVLHQTAMPAVLIEAGFMTSHKEAQYMLDTAFQHDIAEAATRGLCAWLNVPYIAPEATAPPEETQPPTDATVLYRMQVGAFTQYQNAQAQLEQLHALGYTDAFITEVKA